MLGNTPLIAGSVLLSLAAPAALSPATHAQPPKADSSWNVVSETPVNNLGPMLAADAHGQVYAPAFTPKKGLRPDQSSVAIIDGSTGKIIKTIANRSALAPANGDMAYVPGTDSMYMPVFGSASVDVINGTSHSITANIPQAKSMPWGAAYDSGNNTVYVSDGNDNSWLSSGQVYAINPATNKIVTSIPVDDSAANLAADPSQNKLFVTVEQASSTGGAVQVIDTATNTVEASIPVEQGAHGIAVDTQLHKAYVLAQDEIEVIDTQTDAVVGTIPLPTGVNAADIALNPATHQLFLSGTNSIVQVNGTSDSVVGTIPLTGAKTLFGITVNPVNQHVFVSGMFTAGSGTRDEVVQLAPTA